MSEKNELQLGKDIQLANKFHYNNSYMHICYITIMVNLPKKDTDEGLETVRTSSNVKDEVDQHRAMLPAYSSGLGA